MFVRKLVIAVFAVVVLSITTASAQQTLIEKEVRLFGIVRFDVVVMTASGECVTNLQLWDFKVFDNNSVQAITSFKAGRVGPKMAEAPQLTYAAGARTNGCYDERGLFRYEIAFKVPRDARLNEYRDVGISVKRPNLVVRARQGYYVRF
ncbi:hypothetical protein [Edaphobacter aggregans]|uniref:hypothetical protein n=1 Tax=Edaphobacter aggregans TaxID=570835 RepID=UPI000550DD12|nr:hypothetical protein [Edaphobacter aggregans]